MKPSEANPADYSLYYDNTWLFHEDLGPVYARADGRARIYTTEAGNIVPLEIEKLDVWWPRSGSYNNLGAAVYVGRRSRRSMKKSANNDCYFVVWGRSGKNPLNIIAKGYNFLSYSAAREAIDKRVMDSVAITRDIILARTERPDSYSVICRGQDAGFVTENHFVAHLEGAPAAKLARIKLSEVGITQA